MLMDATRPTSVRQDSTAATPASKANAALSQMAALYDPAATQSWPANAGLRAAPMIRYEDQPQKWQRHQARPHRNAGEPLRQPAHSLACKE